VLHLAILLMTGAFLVVFRDTGLVDAIAVCGFLPFLCFYPANYYCNYLMPMLLFAFNRRPAALQLPLGVLLAGACGPFFIADFELDSVYLSGVILVWLGWTVAEQCRGGTESSSMP
jgi:hypothetical protein